MSTALRYVGLDVGGTTMKAAVIDDEGIAAPAVSLPTEAHRGQEAGLERMCETIRAAVSAAGMTMDQITAIGVATPGIMDIAAGLIVDPPNLKPWKNVQVRGHIAEVFQKPTAFQNDANAAAFGEYWIGTGRDAHSMVLFTLGTGVGGGIIIGDQVIEGRHSHGGELGHMRIQLRGGRLCGCGRLGCLEAYASATAVVARAREEVATYTGSTKLKELLQSASGEEFSSRTIFDAAAHGDELAEKIVDDTAFYLAVGATNMMHSVDPDLILFGGGMIAAGESFLNRIRKHVHEIALPIPAERCEIRYASLGSDAGFIGAAACARQLIHRQRASSK
ncbi:ROK family protein [Tuwongella immobilis]|nr:ROK family protein [Tuwongella immobilis]